MKAFSSQKYVSSQILKIWQKLGFLSFTQKIMFAQWLYTSQTPTIHCHTPIINDHTPTICDSRGTQLVDVTKDIKATNEGSNNH